MKTQKQDYEIACDELSALYNTLGITSETSTARAGVRDNWPHITYTITFKNKRGSLTEEYRLGVGHVKWPKKIPHGTPAHLEPVFNALGINPHAALVNKQIHAEAASFLATRQQVKPDPAEVLANLCREALTATESTFEDWAADYGYNTDSRKAEATFNQCREPYPKLLALCGLENVRKLAELSSRL